MKKLMFMLPILSGMMWASSGVFVRFLTDWGMENFTLLFSRVSVAVLMLGIGLYIYDKSLLKIKLKDLWMFMGGGLFGMFAINLCYNEAIKDGSLTLAAVLLSMSPIFVVFLSLILFHEPLTKHKLLCMAIALVGCVLVSGVLEGESGLQWSVRAIFFGTLSAFFYGLYSIFSKFAMDKGYHALTTTFYSMGISVFAFIPWTQMHQITGLLHDGGIKMGIFMLSHALIAAALPYVLFTVALAKMEAGKVSILAASEPAAAMVFGLLFFSEKPTILSIIGLLLTIVAMILIGSKDDE